MKIDSGENVYSLLQEAHCINSSTESALSSNILQRDSGRNLTEFFGPSVSMKEFLKSVTPVSTIFCSRFLPLTQEPVRDTVIAGLDPAIRRRIGCAGILDCRNKSGYDNGKENPRKCLATLNSFPEKVQVNQERDVVSGHAEQDCVIYLLRLRNH